MVLVTALLMLIVVTILAVAMFRSFGLDEKIAGNLREKQRALNAAETAEQFAEYWLTGAAAVPIAAHRLFEHGDRDRAADLQQPARLARDAALASGRQSGGRHLYAGGADSHERDHDTGARQLLRDAGVLHHLPRRQPARHDLPNRCARLRRKPRYGRRGGVDLYRANECQGPGMWPMNTKHLLTYIVLAVGGSWLPPGTPAQPRRRPIAPAPRCRRISPATRPIASGTFSAARA